MNDTQMSSIIIACEDTYGLDVYMMIEAINASRSEKKYTVLGFLNEDPDTWKNIDPPKPILGRISDWRCQMESKYIIAIRKPKHKRMAVEKLKAYGAEFETIIAPWVQHPSEFEHGEGCIIANYNFKHKSRFGDFVIMDTCMCESVEIGDYSTLCPFVNITTASIGNSVFIGSHSAIISGRKINDNTTIYPGSIVLSNIKDNMSVAGVPATKNINKWEAFENERNRCKQFTTV